MKESSVIWICLSIVSLALISGVVIYHTNITKLMSVNIDTAISKGIDPISVRCSFANSHDVICVAYATSLDNRKEVILKSTK
jgi:hypothetical protein